MFSELAHCQDATASFIAPPPAPSFDCSSYAKCRDLYMLYRRKVPLLGVLHTESSSAGTASSIRALQDMELERQQIEKDSSALAAQIVQTLKHKDGTTLAGE